MLSYILLFLAIALVIVAILKFTKPRYPGSRSQQEPFFGVTQLAMENDLDQEGIIGEPRIVRTPTPRPAALQHPPIKIDESVAALTPSSKQTTETPQAAAPEIPPSDMIVLHLLADAQRPYGGYELLQTLLRKGFRYGKWNIFHFHTQPLGRGPILFSLASSIEPGTFDLAKMENFSTAGLTLFLRISNTDQPMRALEKCLHVAHQMVSELGGKICDEKRDLLTHEKMQSWQMMCQEEVVLG